MATTPLYRLITLATFALTLTAARVQAQTYTDLYNFGDSAGAPLSPSYSGIIA
jgi:hypothetical protein